MKWVRPVLSIMGFAAVTAGFFLELVDAKAYFVMVAGIITWWFRSRDQSKIKGK